MKVFCTDLSLKALTPIFIPSPVDFLSSLSRHDQRRGITRFPGRVNAHDAAIDRADAHQLLLGKNHVALAIEAREDAPNVTLLAIQINIFADRGDNFQA